MECPASARRISIRRQASLAAARPCWRQEKAMFKSLITAAATLVIAAGAASAAGMLTAKNGMTLYVFDKDTGADSTCYADCATNWPPYLGKKGDKMMKDWTMVKRTDGKMQWAYDGHPLYFFKADKKKGDMAGDGMGGVWHIVKE
jgi:predicted lipoprotein with Yx(FWY)xxD motif